MNHLYRFSFVLIFALAIIAPAFCQDPGRTATNPPIIIFPQGILFESAGGAGLLNGNWLSPSSIASINPAKLAAGQSPVAGFSYQYRSTLSEFFPSIPLENQKHSDGLGYLPQSAGILVPAGKVNLAFGFRQSYNSQVDLGEILITTVEDPDGLNGQTFNPTFDRYLNAFSIAITGQAVDNPDGISVGLGLRLKVNSFRIEESLFRSTATGSDLAFNGELGLAMAYSNLLTVSASVQNGYSFDGEFEIDPPLMSIPDPATGDSIPANLDVQNTFSSELPLQIQTAIAVRLVKGVWLSGNLEVDFWGQIEPHTRNNISISYGANWFRSDGQQYSLGLLRSEPFSDITTTVNYFYLGTVLKFNHFTVEFLWADSHFISNEIREHSIIKTGLGFSL